MSSDFDSRLRSDATSYQEPEVFVFSTDAVKENQSREGKRQTHYKSKNSYSIKSQGTLAFIRISWPRQTIILPCVLWFYGLVFITLAIPHVRTASHPISLEVKNGEKNLFSVWAGFMKNVRGAFCFIVKNDSTNSKCHWNFWVIQSLKNLREHGCFIRKSRSSILKDKWPFCALLKI